jgi:tetratricopeptide (TPR) repeat protein
VAIAAGALGVLLSVSPATVTRGAIAMPSSVAEILDDCKDDEIYSAERQRLCSELIDDSQLPAEVRAEALVNRGIVLLSERETDRALADFEAAIALNPRDAIAHAYRGEVHKAKGQFEKARSEYDIAISLDGASADLFVNRGEIHRQLGARDKAKSDFETALRIEPDHYVARDSLKSLSKNKKK